jgi:biotin operon repressor
MNKTDKVLRHLKKGRWISGQDALRLYSLYRLSAVIYNLRRKGYEIETDMVKGVDGESEFARYRLAK